jgi:sugar lactone lactonase YvrE
MRKHVDGRPWIGLGILGLFLCLPIILPNAQSVDPLPLHFWRPRIPLVPTPLVTNVCGQLNGDGGPATEACINGPSAISIDENGNLYIAEMVGRRVRMVNAKTGAIKTVAGSGQECCFEEGKTAILTTLFSPTATAVDRRGEHLYIVDISSHVRVVDLRTGIATTVAADLDGMGADKSGRAQPLPRFEQAKGVALAPPASLYVVGSFSGKIYKVSYSAVTEFAGIGGHGFAGDGQTAHRAQFNWPMGIAFNSSGDFFIADYENCRIRKIDGTGLVSTIAGTGQCNSGGDGGKAIAAMINHPSAIAVDRHGNVYFNDAAPACVRRIDSKTSLISSVPGTCESKPGHNGGPSGLAVDKEGNLYITEFGSNVVRRVDVKTGAVSTVAGNGLPDRFDVQM